MRDTAMVDPTEPSPPLKAADTPGTEDQALAGARRPTLLGHLRIMRIDHWIKNVFVLPGIVAAVAIDRQNVAHHLVWRAVIGLLASGLVASSNYVINEIMDAPFDRFHPGKATRPVATGQVHVPLGIVQWLALGAAGIALGRLVSPGLAVTLGVLWLMGCVYNIRPLRTKDVPYLDVLSEAVNNPLRMMAGWLIGTDATIAPISLLISYWMIGAYFMALKRFAEYRSIGNRRQLALYRRSLTRVTPRRMLATVVFYASAAMLFFGAFIMRYRLELVLSFPLVALVMSTYFSIAFKPESAAQHPEKLYREPVLMAVCLVCAALMIALLFVDLPGLHRMFAPVPPVQRMP